MAETIMLLLLYISAVCAVLFVLGVAADFMPNKVLFRLEKALGIYAGEPNAKNSEFGIRNAECGVDSGECAVGREQIIENR